MRTQIKFGMVATLTSFVILLSACGKTEFNTLNTTQNLNGPGNFIIPPKVDILMVEDDTGSMHEAYGKIATETREFLNYLDRSEWNYHFAAMPLTQYRAIRQSVGSVYDSNRGSSWKPSYPGEKPNAPGTLLANVFQLPSTFTDFISKADISNQFSGLELGFENIKSVLSTGVGSSNFLRKDSLPVILVVGNGDDNSRVNFCTRSDGRSVPCEDVHAPVCTSLNQSGCSSKELSFNHYKSWLQTNVPNVKFYAAVAYRNTENCLGGSSTPGTRYGKMARALGGQTYDVCTQPINQVLSSLAQSLQAQKQDFRQKYLFLDQEPNVSTIVVTRNSQGVNTQIPQDSQNGWTYAGLVKDVYAIDYPTEMNLSSGYAIELHGTAKISGADTVSLEFKPASAQSLASQ